MIYNYSRHLISVSDFASKSLLIRSGFNDKKDRIYLQWI